MPISTPMEIIVAVLAIISLIKIIVLAINKKKWLNGVVNPMYKHARTSAPIFGILAIIVFYYLLQEMTLTQIFAGIAFTTLLLGFGFMWMAKDLLPAIQKIYKKKFGSGLWAYTIVWLLLILWVLYELFLV